MKAILILTSTGTYSNLENHPKLIRARDATKATRIVLDPNTGMPTVRTPTQGKVHEPEQCQNRRESIIFCSQSVEIDIYLTKAAHVTTTRRKGESKGEKRARKQAAKEERQERRVEKKATQGKFANERKQQLNTLSNPNKGIKKL